MTPVGLLAMSRIIIASSFVHFFDFRVYNSFEAIYNKVKREVVRFRLLEIIM